MTQWLMSGSGLRCPTCATRAPRFRRHPSDAKKTIHTCPHCRAVWTEAWFGPYPSDSQGVMR